MISADENFRFICFLVVKDLDEVDKLGPAGTLSLACWDIFMFCRLQIFSQCTISNNSIRNTTIVSNGLDPGQGQRSARPDLSPNYLQRSSADDKIRCWQANS